MTEFKPLSILGSHAYGEPIFQGCIKVSPADFFVIDELGFEPTGEGEHLYCFIEKQNLDTERVAKILAKTVNVPIRQVSYAGLKDKQAITQQWFSIHLPGKETPDLTALNKENFKVLKQTRHLKKLQKGANKGNRFKIIVQEILGDKQCLDARIKLLQKGVPNYFGVQRFGHQGRNITLAHQLLLEKKPIKNRHLKSIVYSAARSWFFNMQLSRRIDSKTWNDIQIGDLVSLVGSQSVFLCEALSDEIVQRQQQFDIVPAGLLWGNASESKFENIFKSCFDNLHAYQSWLKALEEHGLKMMYRPFVIYPKDLSYQWLDDSTLELAFFLPKGCYATSLLRELVVESNKENSYRG